MPKLGIYLQSQYRVKIGQSGTDRELGSGWDQYMMCIVMFFLIFQARLHPHKRRQAIDADERRQEVLVPQERRQDAAIHVSTDTSSHVNNCHRAFYLNHLPDN